MSAEYAPSLSRTVPRAGPAPRLRLSAAERDRTERSKDLRIALYAARWANIVAAKAWRQRDATLFG